MDKEYEDRERREFRREQRHHLSEKDLLGAIVDELERGFAPFEKIACKISDSITEGLAAVATAISNNQPPTPPGPNRMEKIIMSFIVPDNQADTTYSLTLGDVTDAEGKPVPAPALTIEVTSDDPAVVDVTPDADPKTGKVHFGDPGNATITANITDAEGTLLGTGVAGFVVTAGPPAAIAGVKLGFEGLTETVEPPATT